MREMLDALPVWLVGPRAGNEDPLMSRSILRVRLGGGLLTVASVLAGVGWFWVVGRIH
jgi:hypothetical protein